MPAQLLILLYGFVHTKGHQCDDESAFCAEERLLSRFLSLQELLSEATKAPAVFGYMHEQEYSEEETALLQIQSATFQRPLQSLSEHVTPKNILITLLVITLILLIAFVGILWMTSATDRVETDRRRLQTFAPLFILLYFATTTLVIPDSLDLMTEIKLGATESGWLIAAPWPLQIVALAFLIFFAKDWPWRVQRPIAMTVILALCVDSLFYAAGGDSRWSNRTNFVWLMVARTAIGPCMICGTFLRMAAQLVTLPSENVKWNMLIALCIYLGTGVGPLVSPILSWCPG
jgi:hypothetical protein